METKMALIMMALIMCAFAFGAWQGILEPRHALPLQQENIFHGYAHQDSLLKVQENIQRQQDIIEELLQRTRELSSDDDREAAKIKRAEAFSRLLSGRDGDGRSVKAFKKWDRFLRERIEQSKSLSAKSDDAIEEASQSSNELTLLPLGDPVEMEPVGSATSGTGNAPVGHSFGSCTFMLQVSFSPPLFRLPLKSHLPYARLTYFYESPRSHRGACSRGTHIGEHN